MLYETRDKWLALLEILIFPLCKDFIGALAR